MALDLLSFASQRANWNQLNTSHSVDSTQIGMNSPHIQSFVPEWDDVISLSGPQMNLPHWASFCLLQVLENHFLTVSGLSELYPNSASAITNSMCACIGAPNVQPSQWCFTTETIFHPAAVNWNTSCTASKEAGKTQKQQEVIRVTVKGDLRSVVQPGTGCVAPWWLWQVCQLLEQSPTWPCAYCILQCDPLYDRMPL